MPHSHLCRIYCTTIIRRCSRLGARLAVGLGAALALSACSAGILHPQGPVGLAETSILIDSVAIMLAIVVPTIIAIAAFAFWFRASNARARYLPDWAYSGQIEMVVWGIPALVVLLLGGVAWIGAHDLDPAKPLASSVKPLDVQVVSLDWKWLFLYPDEKIASVNALVVPAGTPVHFVLTSASVMSVFFVPELGSMIYTMNGMATQLNLQADRPGVLYGQSSHFNGDGFSDMHFDVRVMTQDDFAAWAKTTAGAGASLDAQSYRELARQSTMPPTTYRLADAGLFQAILMQKLPPGPGPENGRPTPSVSPRSGEEHVR